MSEWKFHQVYGALRNKPKKPDPSISYEIANKIDTAWQEAYDAGINSTPSVFIQIKSAGRTFKAVPGKDVIGNAIETYLENN